MSGSAGILPPPFIPHAYLLPQLWHLHKTAIKSENVEGFYKHPPNYEREMSESKAYTLP